MSRIRPLAAACVSEPPGPVPAHAPRKEKARGSGPRQFHGANRSCCFHEANQSCCARPPRRGVCLGPPRRGGGSLSSCPPQCGVHTDLHSTVEFLPIQLRSYKSTPRPPPPPGGASWAGQLAQLGSAVSLLARAKRLRLSLLKHAMDSAANTLLAMVHQRDRDRDRDRDRGAEGQRGTERDREGQSLCPSLSQRARGTEGPRGKEKKRKEKKRKEKKRKEKKRK